MRDLCEHEIDQIGGGSPFSLTLTAANLYQSNSVFQNGLLVEYSWSNLWVWSQTLTNAQGTTRNVDASLTSYAWQAPQLAASA